MKKVLVFLMEGFEEVEAITVIDLLRRAKIDVTTASIAGQEVTGSHLITIKADKLFAEVSEKDFDMIILPGGPGTENLRNSGEVLDLVKKQHEANKYVAAICAAPTVLHKAGIVKGKSVTSFPSEEKVFTNSSYFYQNVVVDNNIITSRALGTAIDFSLKLIELLGGEKLSNDIAEKILHTSK